MGRNPETGFGWSDFGPRRRFEKPVRAMPKSLARDTWYEEAARWRQEVEDKWLADRVADAMMEGDDT